MPRQGAPGTRLAPSRRRKKRHRYTLPSTFRPEASTRRETPVAGPPTPHRRTGVFRGPPRPATAPINRARRQAARRVARSRRRAYTLPHVPIIARPSPQQTQAARRRIARAITRAVGPGGSGTQRLARRRVVERDFLADPRTARAIVHYGRAAQRHMGAAQGRRFGVPSATGLAMLGRDRAAAGPAPTRFGIGPASINLTSLGRTIAAQTSLRAPTPGNELVKNALGDVKTLATAPFVAGYEGGAAAFEAARGDTSRAERLASGVWEGLKESVPGQLVQGDPEGAVEAFREHPVFGALDLSAVGAVAGRTGGTIARGLGSQPSRGGLRGGLARAGSTVRPPLALTDDVAGGIVERTYSKDLTREAAQVAADARREPVRRPDGSIVTVTQRGREVPVLKASRTEQRRHARAEADFAASRANSVERLVRDRASREMRVRGIKGRGAKDLVAMVVEGTITSASHFRVDLESHARRLRAEIARHEGGEPVYRHTGELKAAKARLALVERVLASPRAMGQAEKIVAAGEAIGRKLNEREREAVDLGLLTPARAGRSKLVPAAVEHMGARHFTPQELRALEDADVSPESLRHGAIRHADGKFMGNAEVERFLRSRGRDPETVAYLPHRLDVRGRRAFHTQFRPGTRGTMEKGEVRTGSAYRKGVTESSTRLIQEQGVRQETQITKARQLDRMVAAQGMKHPSGRYFTAKEALEVADRLAEDAGQRFVPVRAFAAKLDPETQRIIREDLQGPGAMETLGLRLLNDRVVKVADPSGKARARNVVLMPEEYVKRLQDHLQPAGEITKFFQALNRPFRFAVLAQPRWLVGNFVEPFIVRLTTAGAGVNVFGLGVDIAAATKTLRRMEKSDDPKVRAAAQELRAQQLGGLFIGGRGASVRRSADEFEVYSEVVSKLPVVRQGTEIVGMVGHALMAPGAAYFRLNRAIENVAQRASLGRDIRRDMQNFRGSWLATLRLQKSALDEAGRGLVNTSTQRRFIRSQHELLGKYEGYSPWMRRLVQTALPFVPWALNAVRFTMWTMPAHRTIQTALAVKVNDVVAKDWEEIHRDTPPGALRLAIPTKKGGWVDLMRYTPWGLSGPVSEGDPQVVTDQAFPVLQGPMEAIQGRDPFGRELQIDPSENAGETAPTLGQRLGIAGYGLAESVVPYVGQARRIREGGGTAYAGSNIVDPDVKPGSTHMSGLRRTFDPLRPTYLRAPSSPGPKRRRGPLTQEDRIDAALSRLSELDALDAEQDERINRALRSLGP